MKDGPSLYIQVKKLEKLSSFVKNAIYHFIVKPSTRNSENSGNTVRNVYTMENIGLLEDSVCILKKESLVMNKKHYQFENYLSGKKRRLDLIGACYMHILEISH